MYSTVKIRLTNTPAQDKFNLTELGYAESLNVKFQENIKVHKGASVGLKSVYLPITIDPRNPEQDIYQIYSFANKFTVEPDTADNTQTYNAVTAVDSYTLDGVCVAVADALNYRANATFDGTSVTSMGMDWDVVYDPVKFFTKITFNRWAQVTPDETFITAGDAYIFPEDDGLAFDSTSGDVLLTRDNTFAGNYSFYGNDPIAKDNWEMTGRVLEGVVPMAGGQIGEVFFGASIEGYGFAFPDEAFDSILYGIGVGTDGNFQYCVNGVYNQLIRAGGSVRAKDDDKLFLRKNGNNMTFRVEPSSRVIDDVTVANPGVLSTAERHMMVVDDVITIAGATGMPEINGVWKVSAVVSITDFRIKNAVTGVEFDTTGLGPYDTGSATVTSSTYDFTVQIDPAYYSQMNAHDGSSVPCAVFGDNDVSIKNLNYYDRNKLRTTDLASTAIQWTDLSTGTPNSVIKYILGFSDDLPENGANSYTWTSGLPLHPYGETDSVTVYLHVPGCKSIEGYEGATRKRAPIIGQVSIVPGQAVTFTTPSVEFSSLGVNADTEISEFDIYFTSGSGRKIAFQGTAEAFLLLYKGEPEQKAPNEFSMR